MPSFSSPTPLYGEEFSRRMTQQRGWRLQGWRRRGVGASKITVAYKGRVKAGSGVGVEMTGADESGRVNWYRKWWRPGGGGDGVRQVHRKWRAAGRRRRRRLVGRRRTGAHKEDESPGTGSGGVRAARAAVDRCTGSVGARTTPAARTKTND